MARKLPIDDTLIPPAAAAVPAAADGVGVLFHAEQHPGVVAHGPYLPGITYRVPADEAVRLVTCKRFEYASDADAQRALQFLTAQAAATGTDHWLADVSMIIAAKAATTQED